MVSVTCLQANNAIENLFGTCHNCHCLGHHHPTEMTAFREELALTVL
jgi:hypothetical protein